MRKDAIIDGKAVTCPNASLLGYNKGYKARVGDFLVFSYGEGYGTQFARMIGRVHYAPALGVGTKDETPAVRDWILALVLSSTGCSCYERWIDPKIVSDIKDAPSAMAAFFFQPKLPYTRDMLRRLAEHGTLQEQYVHHAPERVEMFKARLRGDSWPS